MRRFGYSLSVAASTSAWTNFAPQRHCSSTPPVSTPSGSGISSQDGTELSQTQLNQLLLQKVGDLEKNLEAAREALGASQQKAVDATAETRKNSDSKDQVPKRVFRSVVKFYCNVSVPNYLLPWQRKLQTNVTGTGFIVDKKKRLLLTNAHVVAHANFVELRKHGDSAKFTGYIVYMGSDCDLALVHVPDNTFWDDEGLEELSFEGEATAVSDPSPDATIHSSSLARVSEQLDPFAGLPRLQQKVQVVGYPMGGDQISITSGVVSRIDSSPYNGDSYLMSIQIDAAINSGNSGGPAVSDNKVVGVAFQSLTQADNIGYIIANPIISVFARAFMKSAVDRLGLDNYVTTGGVGKRMYHPGFGTIGAFIQDASNENLRTRIGLDPKARRGALITKMLPLGSAFGVLEPGDSLLEVEGHAVASDHTVEFRPNERIRATHLFNVKTPGESASVTILRQSGWNGKAADVTTVFDPETTAKNTKTLQLPVNILPKLMVSHLFNDTFKEKPKFQVFGGIVFSIATQPLLHEWAEWVNNAPRHLTSAALFQDATVERSEIVIIVQVLPHVVNKGYDPLFFLHREVTKVNGSSVRNFKHFTDLLIELGDEDTLDLELMSGPAPARLTFPVKEARAADETLRTQYNVPTHSTEE